MSKLNLFLMVGIAVTSASMATVADAQTHEGVAASAVLVELFTSEGCSSCPPADELLRQVNEQRSSQGQLIIGLSEHVSYWNSLGWKDPFSSEQSTDRQSGYSAKFHTEGPYTPQMVVNGREQFVGSDRSRLREALAQESSRKQVQLRIVMTRVTGRELALSYSAKDIPAGRSLQLVAALVDDVDKSSVLRGENSGHSLQHVFVARALVTVGALHADEERQVVIPLPPEFVQSQQAHHVVLFAQEAGLGAVVGVDAKSL